MIFAPQTLAPHFQMDFLQCPKSPKFPYLRTFSPKTIQGTSHFFFQLHYLVASGPLARLVLPLRLFTKVTFQ